jgi:probable pyridine nucleotide-disulfide oxidoreductase
MSNSEEYEAIVIGSGKGGKILATYLGKQNHKVALIERDPMMIGGGCINVACIPTKNIYCQCSTCSLHSASGRVWR